MKYTAFVRVEDASGARFRVFEYRLRLLLREVSVFLLIRASPSARSVRVSMSWPVRARRCAFLKTISWLGRTPTCPCSMLFYRKSRTGRLACGPAEHPVWKPTGLPIRSLPPTPPSAGPVRCSEKRRRPMELKHIDIANLTVSAANMRGRARRTGEARRYRACGSALSYEAWLRLAKCSGYSPHTGESRCECEPGTECEAAETCAIAADRAGEGSKKYISPPFRTLGASAFTPGVDKRVNDTSGLGQLLEMAAPGAKSPGPVGHVGIPGVNCPGAAPEGENGGAISPGKAGGRLRSRFGPKRNPRLNRTAR
jgi:hypothetical protein